MDTFVSSTPIPARKTRADLIELPVPPKVKNLNGQTFGRLRVVSFAGWLPGSEKHPKPRTAWNCHCAPNLGGCDNYTVLRGNTLTMGNTTSCGCRERERYGLDPDLDARRRAHPDYVPDPTPQKGTPFKDIKGETFGFLRVLSRAPDRCEDGNSYVAWNCFCDPDLGGCGGTCVRAGATLRNGTVVSCGCLRNTGRVVRSEDIRRRNREYVRERALRDPRYRLDRNMRAKVWGAIKRGGAKRAIKLSPVLDYTIPELIAYLKTNIPEGFTWRDVVETGDLELDHKRSLWRFVYKDENDPAFKEAWALTNFQLLTKKQHSEKCSSELAEAAAKRR